VRTFGTNHDALGNGNERFHSLVLQTTFIAIWDYSSVILITDVSNFDFSITCFHFSILWISLK